MQTQEIRRHHLELADALSENRAGRMTEYQIKHLRAGALLTFLAGLFGILFSLLLALVCGVILVSTLRSGEFGWAVLLVSALLLILAVTTFRGSVDSVSSYLRLARDRQERGVACFVGSVRVERNIFGIITGVRVGDSRLPLWGMKLNPQDIFVTPVVYKVYATLRARAIINAETA